jgi:hypothetical protein
MGRIGKYNGVDLPREVLIETAGLGTPGAYVTRAAIRVLLQRNWRNYEA